MSKFKIVWTAEGLKDYEYWQSSNPKIATRVDRLLEAIQEDPMRGIGKPKPLHGDLSGYWSRKVNSEHRILYLIYDNVVEIFHCRGHYDDH